MSALIVFFEKPKERHPRGTRAVAARVLRSKITWLTQLSLNLLSFFSSTGNFFVLTAVGLALTIISHDRIQGMNVICWLCARCVYVCANREGSCFDFFHRFMQPRCNPIPYSHVSGGSH